MYDNLIEAIRKMDAKDAKCVLESVVGSINDELKDCGEKKYYIDNLHDSVIFDSALSWVQEVIEQSVNTVYRFKKEG
jgi:hypothetical protein